MCHMCIATSLGPDYGHAVVSKTRLMETQKLAHKQSAQVATAWSQHMSIRQHSTQQNKGKIASAGCRCQSGEV